MSVIENANIPQWLKEELPVVEKPMQIGYNENQQYVLFDTDGTTIVEEFDDLEAAYDKAKQGLKAKVIFHQNLPEVEAKSNRGLSWVNSNGTGMVTGLPKDNNSYGGGRIFFPSSDQDDVQSLERIYERFLQLAEKYVDSKDDFMTAYNFVDSHPAFWTRFNSEKTFRWNTDGHCHKMYIVPFKNDETIFWDIETGLHIAPEYTNLYHDYKIDANGETIEQAYINLASNIYKQYNLDGTSKDDEDFND